MFIQTEATPNPATLKFIPGRTVLDGGTMEFANREAAARSPLAERLFGVSGVTGVFYGSATPATAIAELAFHRLMFFVESPTTPWPTNPGEFTIRELAEKVIALTGSRSELVHRPLPENDPTQRQPDITRAKAMLGWEPTIALDAGLKKTIAYFDGLLASRADVPA